jgi:tetratricopeptide (TPR) repeat protein
MQEIESDHLYMKRTEFSIFYHIALTFYMIGNFPEAAQFIKICFSDALSHFIPDDITRGAMHFFLGMSLCRMQLLDEAEIQLLFSSQTHWIDSAKNEILFKYAHAKVQQMLGRHESAIELFTDALEICNSTTASNNNNKNRNHKTINKHNNNNNNNNNPKSAYILFRRAWSYKAIGRFAESGDDFEIARAQTGGTDANFAIDYRKISRTAYMVLDSEPDFVERFPLLVPTPNL